MKMCIAFLIAGLVVAQPPSPTFRAGTKLVEVDVVAHDRKGSAAGLTKEDFTLLDNGKPQEIAVFSVASARELRSVPAKAIPPGAVSNRVTREGTPPASRTIILLDRLNTPPVDQIHANQRVIKFLKTRRPQDEFAIYVLGNGLKVVQDLTSDPDRLSRAVNNLKGGGTAPLKDPDTTGMSDHAATEYVEVEAATPPIETKHALQAIARHLAGVPGRKNLIWVTESFRLKVGMLDFTPDMQQAARALNDANVALYAVDARGLPGALSQGVGVPAADSQGAPAAVQIAMSRANVPIGPPGVDTMNLLAGLTGGDVFRNDNGIENSLQKVVDDAGITYSLGFYPASTEQAAWHKLKVELKPEAARRGVNLRYRENYFAPGPQAAAAGRPTLNQLVQYTLDSTQIGLLAQATPDPARPGFFDVRVSVDLHDLQLEQQAGKRTGAVDVSFYLESSKTIHQMTRQIEIPDGEFAAALERGIIVDASLPAAAGSTLRIVAQDQINGEAGSLRLALGSK